MANGRRTSSLYGLFESGIPPEVYLRRPGIQSRRNLYEALAQQGLAPIPETSVKGRFSVPINPLQGISKIASAAIGAHGIQNVDKELLQAYEDWKREQDANALAVSEGFADATRPQMVRGETPVVGQERSVNVGSMDTAPPQPSLPEVPGKREMDAYMQPPPVAGSIPPRPDAPTITPADMGIAPEPTPLPGTVPSGPFPEERRLAPEMKRPMQPKDMTISRTMPTVGVPMTGFGQEMLTPNRVFEIAAQIAREHGVPVRQVLSHPAFLSQLRMAEAAQNRANQEFTLSRGQGRYRGGELVAERPDLPAQPKATNWAPKERSLGVGPDGREMFEKQLFRNNAQGEPEWRRIEGEKPYSRGPLATAESSVQMPVELSPYEKKEQERESEVTGEIEKRAKTAYQDMKALKRFVGESDAAPAGLLQPVMSLVQNFFASFGFNPEGLKSSDAMVSAINEMLENRMQELTARGLTDADMRILREHLPKVNTSRESRVNVAGVLTKVFEQDILEYENRLEWVNENWPNSKRTEHRWFKEWKSSRPPEGISREDWDEMTPEERRAFQ